MNTWWYSDRDGPPIQRGGATSSASSVTQGIAVRLRAATTAPTRTDIFNTISFAVAGLAQARRLLTAADTTDIQLRALAFANSARLVTWGQGVCLRVVDSAAANRLIKL